MGAGQDEGSGSWGVEMGRGLDRKAIEVLGLVQARCLWMGGGEEEVGNEGAYRKGSMLCTISRESFSSSQGRLHYSTSTYETPQFTEIILRHRNNPNAGAFSLLGVVLQDLSLSYRGLRVGIYDEAGGSIGARGGR
jgi:hypothetical protein